MNASLGTAFIPNCTWLYKTITIDEVTMYTALIGYAVWALPIIVYICRAGMGDKLAKNGVRVVADKRNLRLNC
jgi:hypothetical protein